ncbi:MAG: hypothetical protein R2753_13825 [Chitinophagales bacterium]
MKSSTKINFLIVLFFTVSIFNVNAQTANDSSLFNIEYDNLEEALKNPEEVFRLNLSDQNLTMLPDNIWDKFKNLQYLSLRNDHLKEIPSGIGSLKNLEVLDLSNNDFKILPQSFSMLENLREIYLNEERNMDVEQSLDVIKDLPNLKIIHLENDNLESIPKNLLNFPQLESLYLNNNRFKKIPINEIKELKNLNFIDFHDNKFILNKSDLRNQESGIIISF